METFPNRIQRTRSDVSVDNSESAYGQQQKILSARFLVSVGQNIPPSVVVSLPTAFSPATPGEAASMPAKQRAIIAEP